MKHRTLCINLQKAQNISEKKLKTLAKACFDITPKIGVRGRTTFFLDVLHFLADADEERACLQKVMKLLKELGFEAHLALADHWFTAGTLAHLAPFTWVPQGKDMSFLEACSTQAFEFLADPMQKLSPELHKQVRYIKEFLSILGIEKIAEFNRLPISEVEKRFGRLGVDLHQRTRLCGRPPLSLLDLEASVVVSDEFDAPIAHSEALFFRLNKLLIQLERTLKDKHLNTQKLNLYLETDTAQEHALELMLTLGNQDSDILRKPLFEKLEQLNLDSGVISLALEAKILSKRKFGQFHFFDRTTQDEADFNAFLNKLSSHLGPNNVSTPALKNHHLPEKSWSLQSSAPKDKAAGAPLGKLGKKRSALKDPVDKPIHVNFKRPCFVLEKPEPFPFQKMQRSKSVQISERLCGDSWKDKAYYRDYYIVETQDGRRLWVFKDQLQKRYYLHGYFD